MNINRSKKTGIKAAIIREKGVNGDREMAWSLYQAGMDVKDVHMTDLISGRETLEDINMIVFVGGFSNSDVLGSAKGWAGAFIYNPKAKEALDNFYSRKDTLSLGVCNGCQMMSHLKDLIPGASHWPSFERNMSEQFEARFSLVEIQQSPSILFDGMAGSRMPIAVAHGEGRVNFSSPASQNDALVSMKYVDNQGNATERYPYNPNGSVEGITGLTTSDGRFNIMMPHPERLFRTVQHSWHPDDWQEDAPWMRLFRNARVWVG